MLLLAPSLLCLVLFDSLYVVKKLHAFQVSGAVDIVLAVRN